MNKYGIRYKYSNQSDDTKAWTGGWFKNAAFKTIDGLGRRLEYIEDINAAYRGAAAAKDYWKATYDFWVEEYDGD